MLKCSELIVKIERETNPSALLYLPLLEVPFRVSATGSMHPYRIHVDPKFCFYYVVLGNLDTSGYMDR